MTIRRVIEEIKKCGWQEDTTMTDGYRKRWVFKHPDRRDRIAIPGDLAKDLDPHAAGGIIRAA